MIGPLAIMVSDDARYHWILFSSGELSYVQGWARYFGVFVWRDEAAEAGEGDRH
jgi:hypothetical protein